MYTCSKHFSPIPNLVENTCNYEIQFVNYSSLSSPAQSAHFIPLGRPRVLSNNAPLPSRQPLNCSAHNQFPTREKPPTIGGEDDPDQQGRRTTQHHNMAQHTTPSLLLLVCFILSKSGSGLNQTLRVKSLHLSPICRLVVMTTNTHTGPGMVLR